MAQVKTTVPNVIGASEQQAIARIAFTRLKPEVRYIQNPNKPFGVCTGTNPEPDGKFYPYGTKVVVRINNYQPPPPSPPASRSPSPTPPPTTPTPPPNTSPPPITGGEDPGSPTNLPPPPTQYTFYVPETPAAVPPAWITDPTYAAPIGIKQATPDIVLFDQETIDPGYISESYFEEYGGTELINISRHDLINGDQVSYTPITNLVNLRERFNSNNIIDISGYQTNETEYGIDLVQRGNKEPYFNDNGDLIIEIDNIKPDESIEYQIATNGTINVVQTG